jgi:hypothetical protein
VNDIEIIRAVGAIARCRAAVLSTFPVRGGYRFEIYVIKDKNPPSRYRVAWERMFISKTYPDENAALREARELIEVCREEIKN